MVLRIWPSALLFLLACGERGRVTTSPPDAAAGPDAAGGVRARFDLDADLSQQRAFFDLPYPSDLRLGGVRAGGRAAGPEVRGFPNPREDAFVASLVAVAGERPGFPVTPVAYVRFDGAPSPQSESTVIPASAASPLLLVDLGDGPHRGELTPLVASTPQIDPYVPEGLLTVAPRPGILLRPDRRYAFVVRRGLRDASGALLGVPPTLAALARGETPAGARGAAARELYAPLWPVLGARGVPASDVAAATVFTTGDSVRETAELTDRLISRERAVIGALTVDPDDGASHERYCELVGTVRLPQLQRGGSPFDTEGLFEFGADGLPVVQRSEEVPLTITLPKTPMPPGGFPLALYVHGSSGRSSEVVDRGPIHVANGPQDKGMGPAHTLGAIGLAVASSAMPVNVQRRPTTNSGCITVNGYLNFCNLPAMRDVFRQGIFEQRLLLAALRELVIPSELVAACTGLSGGPYRFSDQLVLHGNSMGGMYTNMIGATEPRVLGVVPAGAGGFWPYFILHTSLLPGANALLAATVGAADDWSFMHPVMHLAETAWEAADPMVYMPRLARRPLEGHPVRPILEPVGRNDAYFPTVLYDALVLSYGHPQAGQGVWPTMQEALALLGLGGIRALPLRDDAMSERGVPYTGAVLQYEGDGIDDPHCIVFQRDDLKHQMRCFFKSVLAGAPVIPAPGALEGDCP